MFQVMHHVWMAILHVYQTNMTFVIVFLVSSEHTKKFCQQTFILYKVFVYLSSVKVKHLWFYCYHYHLNPTTLLLPFMWCPGVGQGEESTSLLPTNQEVMKKELGDACGDSDNSNSLLKTTYYYSPGSIFVMLASLMDIVTCWSYQKIVRLQNAQIKEDNEVLFSGLHPGFGGSLRRNWQK